jgi:methyl-accepting chemotaxis protein
MDDNEIKRRLAGRAAEYMMFKDDEEDTEVTVDITSTCNVIVFPDFEKLKNEVERMRAELSMLLLERDELQFVICKNIETEYMLKLGSIEYKAYEAQCAALRLKRKIELIQAKKNRQEKVIVSAIEETLDSEFAEYQKQLNEQIDKMNDALKRSKAEVLSDEDNKKLKKLYRKIVKALHPDINPDVSQAQVQLFDNAVQAYKNGDLNTLKIIGEMVGNSPLPEQHKDALTQLNEEKERLQNLLKAIRDSIEQIKSKFPYTMKEIIEDEEQTEQKKKELENILSQYNELISIYKAKIKEMIR